MNNPRIIPAAESDNCIRAVRHDFAAAESLHSLYFTPDYAGHYLCRRTYLIDRTLPGHTILLLTLAGEGELVCMGRTWQLVPGTVMLIDGACHHRYRAMADGWEFKYIHFDGAMTGQYTDAVTSRCGAVSRPAGQAFLDAVGHADAVMARMDQPPLHAAPAMSRHIYAILTLLLEDAEREPVKADARLQAVIDAAAWLRGHYAEPVSVTELAERCYLSRTYFSKLFRRVCGTSPHEYLLLCRMSRARQLLLETDASAAQIGEACGFPDASGFARAFARSQGMTPRQFREKK